jgi:hypothetical protein
MPVEARCLKRGSKEIEKKNNQEIRYSKCRDIGKCNKLGLNVLCHLQFKRTSRFTDKLRNIN